jgi:hypothetical protein
VPKIRSLLFVLLASSPVVFASDTFVASSYSELYSGVAQNYANGFSRDPFEDPSVRTTFSNPSDSNMLFKLASESEISFLPNHPNLMLIHPRYFNLEAHRNILRDNFGNMDFYLARFSKDNFEVVGRMALYASCKEGEMPKKHEASFTCTHLDKVQKTVDVFTWDGEELQKLKSHDKIRTDNK